MSTKFSIKKIFKNGFKLTFQKGIVENRLIPLVEKTIFPLKIEEEVAKEGLVLDGSDAQSHNAAAGR